MLEYWRLPVSLYSSSQWRRDLVCIVTIAAYVRRRVDHTNGAKGGAALFTIVNSL